MIISGLQARTSSHLPVRTVCRMECGYVVVDVRTGQMWTSAAQYNGRINSVVEVPLSIAMYLR